MYFNFDVPLLNDENVPVLDDTNAQIKLSKIIRDGLKNEMSSDKNVIYFGWCLELANDGKLDLDAEGVNSFKKWLTEPIEMPITSTQTKKISKFTATVEYRILEVINNKSKEDK